MMHGDPSRRTGWIIREPVHDRIFGRLFAYCIVKLTREKHCLVRRFYGAVTCDPPFQSKLGWRPIKLQFKGGGSQFLILSQNMIFVDHPTASHNVGIECPTYIRHWSWFGRNITFWILFDVHTYTCTIHYYHKGSVPKHRDYSKWGRRGCPTLSDIVL
jgi:hypothetical protein